MKPPRKRWPKGTWMRLISGPLLRGMMDKKNLSNADVAMAAGVGRTFISALVNERRTSCTPRVADRIAERLDVTTEMLFVPKASAGGIQNTRPKRKSKVAA